MKRRLGPRTVGRVWDKAFVCHVGVVFSVPRRGWVGGCNHIIFVGLRVQCVSVRQGRGVASRIYVPFQNQPYIVVGEELFIGLVHDDNVHFS